jgi:hypothetical protein
MPGRLRAAFALLEHYSGGLQAARIASKIMLLQVRHGGPAGSANQAFHLHRSVVQ